MHQKINSHFAKENEPTFVKMKSREADRVCERAHATSFKTIDLTMGPRKVLTEERINNCRDQTECCGRFSLEKYVSSIGYDKDLCSTDYTTKSSTCPHNNRLIGDTSTDFGRNIGHPRTHVARRIEELRAGDVRHTRGAKIGGDKNHNICITNNGISKIKKMAGFFENPSFSKTHGLDSENPKTSTSRIKLTDFNKVMLMRRQITDKRSPLEFENGSDYTEQNAISSKTELGTPNFSEAGKTSKFSGYVKEICNAIEGRCAKPESNTSATNRNNELLHSRKLTKLIPERFEPFLPVTSLKEKSNTIGRNASPWSTCLALDTIFQNFSHVMHLIKLVTNTTVVTDCKICERISTSCQSTLTTVAKPKMAHYTCLGSTLRRNDGNQCSDPNLNLFKKQCKIQNLSLLSNMNPIENGHVDHAEHHVQGVSQHGNSYLEMQFKLSAVSRNLHDVRRLVRHSRDKATILECNYCKETSSEDPASCKEQSFKCLGSAERKLITTSHSGAVGTTENGISRHLCGPPYSNELTHIDSKVKDEYETDTELFEKRTEKTKNSHVQIQQNIVEIKRTNVADLIDRVNEELRGNRRVPSGE